MLAERPVRGKPRPLLFYRGLEALQGGLDIFTPGPSAAESERPFLHFDSLSRVAGLEQRQRQRTKNGAFHRIYPL